MGRGKREVHESRSEAKLEAFWPGLQKDICRDNPSGRLPLQRSAPNAELQISMFADSGCDFGLPFISWGCLCAQEGCSLALGGLLQGRLWQSPAVRAWPGRGVMARREIAEWEGRRGSANVGSGPWRRGSGKFTPRQRFLSGSRGRLVRVL